MSWEEPDFSRAMQDLECNGLQPLGDFFSGSRKQR
jgi:hypothetical protein